MAKLGKAQITLAKSDPKPMFFQWSKSETIFTPQDTSFWITGSSFIFYSAGMVGTIPYKANWITDWTKVAAAKTDVYKYLWCKLTENSEPFLFTGYSGLSITTTREYTLQDNGALTEEQQQALPASAWVEEELMTWSWGKYLYKRLKRTTVETGEIVYTYSGRDTAAEDSFKKRLVFALTADRAVYTIDKRALAGLTEIITLRLDERYYNPDSLVWTLNGESFTPTQSESDSTVYSYEIAPLTVPSSQVIVVTPYRSGEAIAGVSATVTLIGQDRTDYYNFVGLVTALPGTAGYIKGDSCFLSTDNLIYTFDGTQWTKLSASTLTDEEKIDVLTKAEKTAFEYAKDNGLSQDYGYFDVIFAAYVKARAIGAETIKLTGADGKLVGGDWETADKDGYLANQGVYIDSSGVGKFTQALLNNCHIKGGDIEVLSVTGELINDVLTTNQTAVPGEEVTIGSIDTANPYYMGSQAKAKIKSLLAHQDSIYQYSGTYAGRSFAKIFNGSASPNLPYWQNYKVTLNDVGTAPLDIYSYIVFGNGCAIIHDRKNTLKATSDFTTWTDVTPPFYMSRIPRNSAQTYYTYWKGRFWAYAWMSSTENSNYLRIATSTDGKTWTIDTSRRYDSALPSISMLVGFWLDNNYMYLTVHDPNGSGKMGVYIFENGSYSDYVLTAYTDRPDSISSLSFLYGTSLYQGASVPARTLTTPAGYISDSMRLHKLGSELYVLCAVARSGYWAIMSCCAMDDWEWYETGTALSCTGTPSSVKFYPYDNKNLLVVVDGTVYLFNDWIYNGKWTTVGTISGLTVGDGLNMTTNTTKINFINTADKKMYQIDITQRIWQPGLNFLNSEGDLVCYESAMGDYMQNQTLTLNDGTASLLSLPGAIPSTMDVYRKLPKPFDASAIYLSINKCTIEEYVRFDTSTNTLVTVSAIDTTKETNPDAVPLRIDTSTTSLIVDGVEKANSTWFIRNKASLVAKFTPNSKASGVETGNLNPKEELTSASIGTIRPYKVIQATSLRAEKLENVYPVGSCYLGASEDADPNTFLGGTWEKLGVGTIASNSVHLWMRKQ